MGPFAWTVVSAGLALLPAMASTATTFSIADTSAAIGLNGSGGRVEDGPAARPTSVNGHTRFEPPGLGYYVDSRMEASAGYGRLHARGTVQTAAPYSAGMAGSLMGGDPLSVAGFEDQILIGGGGVAPHVFKVFYSLTGFAGQIGSASMEFAADLSLQAWGLGGVTITGSSAPPTGFSFSLPPIDTYSVSVSGSSGRSFGESGWVEITATDGSTLNLGGYLGAYLRLREPGDTHALSTAALDIWNTGSFSIVPLSAGTTFTAVSGFNYVTPVPEPREYALFAGLGLVGFALWHRRAAKAANG
jgi:hypothetical protein